MRPYFYILAVLLVGGSVGYFIGQRTGGPGGLPSPSSRIQQDDRAMIERLLDRQKEGYASHDEFLLFRDCAASYVEINASTGEALSLQRAMIYYHELLKPGKAVNVLFDNLVISVIQNAALVQATYSKTSDLYEQQGFTGLTGKVLWLLLKEGDRWRIVASAWTEEKKH